MNEIITSENSGSQAKAEPEKRSIPQLIFKLAHAFEHSLSPGEIAELRRLDPHDPSSSAFFKMSALYLEPAGVFPSSDIARNQSEQKWACILAAMALLNGLNEQHKPLGAALAQSGFSELRFARLLRAQGESLFDAICGAARFLAAKGASVDCSDLAWLLLSEGLEHAEETRRKIARFYYSALYETNQEGAKTS